MVTGGRRPGNSGHGNHVCLAHEIRDGVVIANYADRRPEESMAVSPSVGMSKYLVIKAGKLVTMEPMGKGN